MRLLERAENDSYTLVDFTDEDPPPYAILSHTWAEDNSQEVTFQDLEAKADSPKDKAGWRKLELCADQAKADRLQYFWIDTCCINKWNAVELAEAINSMFKWYKQASKCYVFLSDVSIKKRRYEDKDSTNASKLALCHARWFTRGWTLQELLAPTSVEFYSAEWKPLGNKDSLKEEIHEVTGLPIEALLNGDHSKYGVLERFGWTKNRKTKRAADSAYCLLGLFGVRMSPDYSETKDEALERLRRKIRKRIREQQRPIMNRGSPSPSDDDQDRIHPVKHNYRRVFVTICYWTVDGVDAKVLTSSISA